MERGAGIPTPTSNASVLEKLLQQGLGPAGGEPGASQHAASSPLSRAALLAGDAAELTRTD